MDTFVANTLRNCVGMDPRVLAMDPPGPRPQGLALDDPAFVPLIKVCVALAARGRADNAAERGMRLTLFLPLFRNQLDAACLCEGAGAVPYRNMQHHAMCVCAVQPAHMGVLWRSTCPPARRPPPPRAG